MYYLSIPSFFKRYQWTGLHACIVGWAEFQCGLRTNHNSNKTNDFYNNHRNYSSTYMYGSMDVNSANKDKKNINGGTTGGHSRSWGQRETVASLIAKV